jgi:HEAT repeat protein
MRRRFLCPALVLLTAALLTGAARPAQDEDPTVRGKYRASQMVTFLKTADSPKARGAAARLLGEVGIRYRKGLPALVTALKEDKDEAVREAAAEALGKVGQAAQDVKEKTDRPSAEDLRDAALDGLRAALKADRSPKVRAAAAAALGRIATDPNDPNVRADDARLLANHRATAVVLTAALKETDAEARAAAADSLGRLALLVQKRAMPALAGTFEEQNTVAALVEAFKDRKADRFVRGYAALAICRLGGDEARAAVPALAEALTEASAPVEVRRAAAEALGALKGDAAEAAGALGQALKDKSVIVRRAAAAALDQIGPGARPALAALKEAAGGDEDKVSGVLPGDEDKFVRAFALHALGALTDDARDVIKNLTHGMKDQLLDVRLAAIEALGRLGPAAEAAAPALRAASRDSQKAVRDAAEEALKKVAPSP